MKWKCGCGKETQTKKECEEHVKRVHGEEIRTTAGLASLRYHCQRIGLPKPKPKSDVDAIDIGKIPTTKTPFVTRKEIDYYFKKKGFKGGL